MTKLSWNEYWNIAKTLEEMFPETELSNIKRVDVLKLVRQIPNFTDTLNPTKDDINSLIYSWLDLRNPEEKTEI
ncbi:MAG: hypothetical protein BWY78_00729 [Alphaproteobacteria bacterium ADurb.Bin438]|nr:MAG: hypothetical protein BWY78_00729 [Alphaproteobacteria bacterium ADurb.Bin438]